MWECKLINDSNANGKDLAEQPSDRRAMMVQDVELANVVDFD
jgi:hypothetical protein